jgi:hypothetical protein
MRYHLGLEVIGYGRRGPSGVRGEIERIRRRSLRPCVKQHGREIRAQTVDSTSANSNGTRGTLLHFFLAAGDYDVADPRSWTRTDHYRLRVTDDGEATHLDE